MAVAAVMLLVRAGSVPLLDPDESRLARTSVEMLASGDLVVPTFQGQPRLVKPPLFHWIQSFLFRGLGATELAARLPAVAATLGSILLVGWIGRRRFGDLGGTWAAVIFASMPLVFVLGRTGTIDALLSVHVLAAVALDLAGPPDAKRSYRALSLGGLLGLAFLAKGPVGVALPLLVMLAGRTAAGREVLPSLGAWLYGSAAWAAVVLPWGLAFLARIGTSQTGQTVRTEVLERYFSGTVHVEPFWYYAKVVAVGFLPWVGPLAIGFVRVWTLRKEPEARTARYLAAGLLAGLVFLSLGYGKLPSYILPLAPLAALLITWELARESEAPERRTVGPALLASSVAACAILLALASAYQLSGDQKTAATTGAIVFGAGAIFALHGAWVHRPQRVYGAAAAATAGLLLAAVLVLFPGIGRARSAAALIEAVPQLSSGRPLITVELRLPGLTFYLDRVPEVVGIDRFEARASRADDPLFLLADVDLPDVPEELLDRLQRVGRHGKFLVFEKRACRPVPDDPA